MQSLLSGGGVELTIDCINSLLTSEIDNLNIVVVDNNSPDDSLEKVTEYSKHHDNVIVLASKENNGFSAGNNIGIRYSLEQGADYILLVNNDTVIDKKMISILASKCNPNCITVPKIYYYSEPNKIWYAGGHIDYKTGRFFHYGENCIDSDDYSKKRHVNFASGCCLMISSTTIKNIGFLDEAFFMYCEDVEYSLRAIKNEISILFCPEAKMWHKVGSSAGNKSSMSLYYGNRNRLYVLKEYKFGVTAWIFTLGTRFIYFLKGTFLHTNEVIIGRAISDFFKGITGKVAIT